jgi:hypothetical protein
MSVPKTAVNEDNFLPTAEDKIGATGKITPMKSIA